MKLISHRKGKSTYIFCAIVMHRYPPGCSYFNRIPELSVSPLSTLYDDEVDFLETLILHSAYKSIGVSHNQIQHVFRSRLYA